MKTQDDTLKQLVKLKPEQLDKLGEKYATLVRMAKDLQANPEPAKDRPVPAKRSTH